MDYGHEPGAIELAAKIAAGELSSLEACDAAIARIEARDVAINAVIIRDFENARHAARKADERLKSGERAPLLGVPMTVKESFDIAGLPSSWGFEAFRDHVAAADSHVVQRLKGAGAVILGKTNVALALADWQATNPVYGRTVNPLDITRSPGGSSGGSAAALAANMVPLEFGSDIGGSIRVPAHFCGVFGHKPTYGAIPADGHFFPGTDGADPVLGVVGPMARSAADMAMALDLVARPPLPAARIQILKDKRLLLIEELSFAACERTIAAAVREAADRCADEGAIVETRSPLLPDLQQLHRSYMNMLTIALTGGAEDRGGNKPTLQDWMGLFDTQARAQRQWDALFSEYDAVLCPVLGTTAFPHDNEPQMRNRTLYINGQRAPFGAQFGWVGIATFPGLPATSAPIGRDAGGLPINIQVIANRFDDHSAIALGGIVSALMA